MKSKMKKATSTMAGMEFETTHGAGFAPSWKPSNAGEFILFIPTNVIRELPKNKKVKKAGHVIEVIYKGGNSDNFYQGSGKKSTQVELKEGETIALMLSHNLMAADSICVQDGKDVVLSPLSVLSIEKGALLKVLFEGKIQIGGGRSVNQFITQAPKGFKQESQKYLGSHDERKVKKVKK